MSLLKRALITLGGGCGDLVMATPTVAALHELGYGVDALVESRWPDAALLLAGWRAVESIYLDRASLTNSAATRPYGVVVRTVAHGGAPLGLGDEVAPDPAPGTRRHDALRNLSALAGLGFRGALPAPHVESDLPFWPLPARYLAVAPGCGGVDPAVARRKRWPFWQRFCDRAHAASRWDVVVLGAPDDAREWMDDSTRPWLHGMCGRTSLRGAAGVIARAEELVAVDNGLAHLGGALDQWTTVLFGPTDPETCHPLGQRVRLVTAPVDCRPCHATARWETCDDRRCMEVIPVPRVLEALELQEAP